MRRTHLSGGLVTTAAVCVIVLCAWTVNGAHARRATLQKSIISARTDLVVLHALVEDHGAPVVGLTKDNFEVFEDNSRQTISFFGKQDEPVTAGILVDNSSSMAPSRDRVIAAGLQFVRLSNSEDELFVVHFNDQVNYGLPSGTPFTGHLTTLQQALLRMSAVGKTALYDAIWAGLDHLREGTRQSRVLVLVSDGGDNASRHSRDEVLDRIRRTDILIFSIALITEFHEHEANPKVLKELALSTGGRVWRPRQVQDLPPAFEQIAKEIRSGYSLGYVSTNRTDDGAFRKIRVIARGADGRKLSVRARDGYIAASNSGGL